MIKTSSMPIISATAQIDSRGGTAILVRRDTVHHSVPNPDMTHFEATAIQVTMAGKLVKIFAAFLSPSRSLIGVDLSACFGGECRS
jgi:hypothetical protein